LINALRRDLKLAAVPVRLEFRGRSNPFDKGRR
jgi:GTP-binding protein